MKWEAKPLTHKKEQRIAVFFEKNSLLTERIKKWKAHVGVNP